MKLSTKGRYGLKAMIYLAVHYTEGQITISTIAERQNISESYLEQLLFILKKAGLVKSIRGHLGGYILSQKPEGISVGTVLSALEGSLAPVDCVVENNHVLCDHFETCATKLVWEKIKNSIYDVVDSITLEDLAEEYRKLNKENEKSYWTEITQKTSDSFQKIILEYADKDLGKRKLAFNGRWLVTDEKGKTQKKSEGFIYSVALTEKEQIFVYYRKQNFMDGSGYSVYPSLEDLKKRNILPPDILNKVSNILNEDDILFLDI